MDILATGYLKEGALCFTKVTGVDEKTNKDGGKAETVSDLEEETKKNGFI